MSLEGVGRRGGKGVEGGFVRGTAVEIGMLFEGGERGVDL